MADEHVLPDMEGYDWSRPLVVGGLATLDTEDVFSYLSHINRLAEKVGQRIRCVLHVRSKGVSPRAMMWAQSNGYKHAPFLISGKGKEAQDSLKRVFDVGRPSVCIVFPGMALTSIRVLDLARKNLVPVFHVDEFYPIVTLEECIALGISHKKAMSEVVRLGNPSWHKGTIEEIRQLRELPPDNSFLQLPAQKVKFSKVEKELFGKKH